MMQLIIPALKLIATPAHLFISRLKAEVKGGGISEVERMATGRRWLDKEGEKL